MADDLRELATLTKSDDELHLGGNKGGTTLRRSELQLLRRSFSDRLPFTEADRQSSVRCVMDIINGTESTVKKLTALSVFASMEKRNLEELALYVKAKLAADHAENDSVSASPVTINFNVVEQVVVKAELPATPPVIEHIVESANGRNGHKDG